MRALLILLAALGGVTILNAFAQNGPAPAVSPQLAACESLAAHPSEPGHQKTGIETRDLDPVAAFGPCLAAFNANPADLPTMFRFARVMLIRDPPIGFDYMKTAAEAGYPPAETLLGRAYEDGNGVAADPHVAMDWYKKGAEHGNGLAMNNLGYLYECGCVKQRDLKLAEKWYAMAAAQGYPGSFRNLGLLAKHRGEGAKAAELFRYGFDLGDAVSGTALADLLATGAIVPKDVEAARALFLEAASAGDPGAYAGLADLEDSLGNYEAESVALQKGISAGNSESLYLLGRMYKNGTYKKGVMAEPDGGRWFYYNELAAKDGFATAMIELGTGLAAGEIVPQDLDTAEAWLKRAAAQDLRGIMALAWFYLHEGRKPDLAEHYYRIAAEQYGVLDGYLQLAEYYAGVADFDRAYSYGAAVMRYGDERQRSDAQSVFRAVEGMKKQRGLDAAPAPTEPVG